MKVLRLNRHLLVLSLAATVIVALLAIACNGDDSPTDSSPNVAVSPNITPGSGSSPVEAIGTYITINGLDGTTLDVTTLAECPSPKDTPGVPAIIALAQFCLTFTSILADSAQVTVELPDSGDTWEMELSYDPEIPLWEITSIDKTS